MLDLTKLARQLPGYAKHLQQEAKISRQRLEKARSLLDETRDRQEDLLDLQKQWRDRLIFSAATPVEAIDTCKDLLSSPEKHTVFATDGSQIAPSHHEIAYCYLVNVGRVMLHYGQSLHPLLDSIPEVFYKAEDLHASKKWGIRTEEWIGHQRTVSEAQMLTEMACRWVQPPGPHFDPNLAMVDGSLVYWFLDGMPVEARDRLLPPILESWEKLRENRIPLMGYLSASRHGEAANFLRLCACKYETPDCLTHCEGVSDRLPCQVIDPLRDSTLWIHFLQPGQRGALWKSSAKILDLYPEQLRVYFCYVHVGTEVARIEVPEWVAADEELFEQSLGIVLAQVFKGGGYPVAIAESHNQAVVKGGDRARFFALLEDQMIKAGLRNVGTSYKDRSKKRLTA